MRKNNGLTIIIIAQIAANWEVFLFLFSLVRAAITLTMGTYVSINNGVYGVAAAFATVTTVLTILCLAVYLRFTKLEDVKL